MNWPHVIEVSDGAGTALFDLPCYVISEPPSPAYDSNTGWRIRGYTRDADGTIVYNVPQLLLWTVYAPVGYAERIRNNRRVRFGPKAAAYNPFHRPINALIAADGNELNNKDDLFLRSMREVGAMLELEIGTQTVNIGQYDVTIAPPVRPDMRFTLHTVANGAYVIADGLGVPDSGTPTTAEGVAEHIGPAAYPLINGAAGLTFGVKLGDGNTHWGYAAYVIDPYTQLLWANEYEDTNGSRVPGYGWWVGTRSTDYDVRSVITYSHDADGNIINRPGYWWDLQGGAVHLYYGYFKADRDTRWDTWWKVKTDGTDFVAANDANKPFFSYTDDTWVNYGVLQSLRVYL